MKDHISKTLSAPRNFLLQRLRQDGGAKILAPIRASKLRLTEAEKALQTVNIYDPNPAVYKKALLSIRAASMNCYAFEGFRDDSIESRASQLQKSIGFGDACTYRLIARNVVNLLTQSQQQLKDSTLKSLDELINSYQLLDDMVDRARDADPVAIERIPDLLQYTRAHVNSFESLIERCLDLPVSNLAPSVTNDS